MGGLIASQVPPSNMLENILAGKEKSVNRIFDPYTGEMIQHEAQRTPHGNLEGHSQYEVNESRPLPRRSQPESIIAPLPRRPPNGNGGRRFAPDATLDSRSTGKCRGIPFTARSSLRS